MEAIVVCRVCGHEAVTLARHLKAAHSVSADQYRVQFPGALIRSPELTAKRSAALARAHQEKSTKGEKKETKCSGCGFVHLVSRFDRHGALCKECLAQQEWARWANLSEPEDYVTCRECGYRAENLTSHIQSAHPDWIGKYPGQIVSLNSAIRDKSHLRGITLSKDTRKKMSENAGRWNKGLTKKIDSRVAQSAEKMLGRPAWSKGLTKEDNPSLQSTSEKLQQYVGEDRPWSNGLKAELTYADFAPFLESDGVDRARMAEVLDYCEETITAYMEKLSLPLSKKYIRERADEATIRLEKTTLETHVLKNGKIQVGCVMRETGHDRKVILRECNRHGLISYTRSILQGRCLTAVSQVLGNVDHQCEWKAWRFTNPKSGHRFRFDGYFPTHNLIVEFHGHQHYEFPSVYIKTQEDYFDLQERDRIKENLVRADGIHYLVIREDEPFDDESYLRERLEVEGVKL